LFWLGSHPTFATKNSANTSRLAMLHTLFQYRFSSSAVSDQAASLNAWLALFAAWLLSLLATAGALFIGEVMGMMPCVLCWYQRIAMFPLTLILSAALMVSAKPSATRPLILVAAILALSGWAVATYHTMLYWDWISPAVTPCGAGPSCKQQNLQLLGFLDIPMLSWLAFSAILFFLPFSLKDTSYE
jgi:disulfide bond formation protein DsbB